MFQVETGIPTPVGYRHENRRKYPWKEMRVGDSFYVPTRQDQSTNKLQTSMGATAAGARKRLHARYTVRIEGDGVRVWRVE